MKNYYDILEVSHSASTEVIRAAFVLLQQQYHPDNLETGDLERSKSLSEAYAVLKDPEKRREYDIKLAAAQHQAAQQPQGRRRGPRPVDGDGFYGGDAAYPSAYAFGDFDLSGMAQDIMTQAAFAAGGAFLSSVLQQMTPEARQAFMEMMDKAKRARGAA